MKKHKGKGKGHHTGKIRHADMTSLPETHAGRDPHADPAHHAANRAAGMPEGCCPQGGYDCDEEEEGGAMGGNAEHY